MARTVQKELATPNVNVYSGQSGKPWSEVEGILHYDIETYIPETLELLSRKYYSLRIRVDIEKHLQDCDICMSSKTQRHKPYGSIQVLPVSTNNWKDLSIDFVTGLPKNKNWRRVEYDSMLVIVDRLTKMVYYKPVLTTLDADQLADILIEAVIKYHGLPDSIVTDRGSLLTTKFWSSLCYYLNIKRWLSIVFHTKLICKPRDKTVLWKLTYDHTVSFSKMIGCVGSL